MTFLFSVKCVGKYCSKDPTLAVLEDSAKAGTCSSKELLVDGHGFVNLHD